MDYIEIAGYKSIKDIKLKLTPINILIGANGAGKSNFISFFEFLNQLYDQKLEEYIPLRGGQDKLLFHGRKVSDEIKSHISFNEEVNGYSFTIKAGDDHMVFVNEDLWFKSNSWSMTSYSSKAMVKTNQTGRGAYVNNFLKGFRKYHFHDTSKNSPFTQLSHVDNDSYFLYEEGKNLAAYLYSIRKDHNTVYQRIIKTIQSIAPFFSDFYFKPNKEGLIRLQWEDKYNSSIYGATDLSDGTIRFVALATLFLQPSLPQSIIIDEPELGLHPFAIAKLAGMIQSVAARGTQVILATQSADLVNHFTPNEIVVVDQIDGESLFARLKEDELQSWLDEYSVGDLWQRNIIQGGQPK